jgi:hypothetical protein
LWKIRNLPHHSKNYLQGQNLKIMANYSFFFENISGMGPSFFQFLGQSAIGIIQGILGPGKFFLGFFLLLNFSISFPHFQHFKGTLEARRERARVAKFCV